MTDSILIVGGGVAGLHAAMECASAGACAIVVEQGPVVGGKLAATMTHATAIGHRAEGAAIPFFDALADNENIEMITLAKLENIQGRPGNFTVAIREQARFVTDACTRCKLCRAVCPVVVANEYDADLTYRKAIYTPLAETLPAPYVIDLQSCLNNPPNYLPCRRCVDVCDDDAIHFDLPLDTVHERQIGAVILAPGFQFEDGSGFGELGYGKHPDIVTSAELQRLLESPGPTGGYASKPSNEEYPERVLLVLDNPSHFALYIVASQVQQLLDQDVETVAVLVLSQPTEDNEYSEVTELADRVGVQVRWGAMFKVEPTRDNALEVSYEDFSANRYTKATYDMVVLCSDVGPATDVAELAQTTGVDLADTGYIAVTGTNGDSVSTSQPGIFVAGCASGPKNIKSSLADAHSSARCALNQLDSRLLQSDFTAEQKATQSESAPQIATEEMRHQIEQLFYALIGRSDG